MNSVIKFAKEWLIPIIIALLFTFLINRFVFFNILVPTESMYPTIKPGDRIVVTKIYNMNNLKRGDCIVFYSKELGDTLIKRLIGLPNDNVEIKANGEVYINGNKTDETYVVYNGGKTGLTFKVPEDQYFFLGDNRGNSKDSRYWSNPFISKDDIKGKARFIMYPFNRFGVLK